MNATTATATCHDCGLKRIGSDPLANEVATMIPPTINNRTDSSCGKKPASGARSEPKGNCHASASAIPARTINTAPLSRSGWLSIVFIFFDLSVGLSASLSVIVALWIVFELVHQPLRVCKLSRINAVLAEAASAERAGREGSVYSLSFNLAPSIGPNNGRNMTGDTKGALPKISAKKFERMEWDPNLRERKTITDYLATALRTAIYDGQFADNEELNQVELAEFFGVSRVPIREALRQLQAEGLVQNIAHHRTIVSGMKIPQILEAIEMRAVLEAHLLRKAQNNFMIADLDVLR